MPETSVYIGLFLAALLAATIIPAQSEALLVGLLISGQYNPWTLVVVASVGNVLGSVINWLLGYGIQQFRSKKWFPVKPSTLDRTVEWYRRYGRWSLLLSWVPIIGDPLTVAAGVMREKLGIFILLVTVAKAGRYCILALVTLKLLEV
ncbi:MAG TPA: YqaA family protein [Chitinophagaceae bacterium]|nr:YqaA family protein [Chitinophagaceae bacterium]